MTVFKLAFFFFFKNVLFIRVGQIKNKKNLHSSLVLLTKTFNCYFYKRGESCFSSQLYCDI